MAVAEGTASPCVQVCQLDPGGTWCSGCGRLLSEIAEWSGADEERRRAIVESARERLQAARGAGKRPSPTLDPATTPR